jgi:hypothetical protein
MIAYRFKLSLNEFRGTQPGSQPKAEKFDGRGRGRSHDTHLGLLPPLQALDTRSSPHPGGLLAARGGARAFCCKTKILGRETPGLARLFYQSISRRCGPLKLPKNNILKKRQCSTSTKKKKGGMMPEPEEQKGMPEHQHCPPAKLPKLIQHWPSC